MSISINGVPTKQELEKVIPPVEIITKGPIVVIECFQNIPCDPCAASCPSGAIQQFEDINDLPVVDYQKCTGCGLCIASCPGLAIFVVDINYTDKEALLKIPYEMHPLPKKGQIVSGLDRAGHKVTDVKVERVQKTKNKTNIITIIIPKEFAMVIRNIKLEDE